jgi:hypothetical protein
MRALLITEIAATFSHCLNKLSNTVVPYLVPKGLTALAHSSVEAKVPRPSYPPSVKTTFTLCNTNGVGTSRRGLLRKRPLSISSVILLGGENPTNVGCFVCHRLACFMVEAQLPKGR